MTTSETTTETKKPAGPASTPSAKANWGRRKLRTEGRKKRQLRLKTDKEFAKTYFEARSKRSTDKKTAFRKKKSRKK